MEFFDACGHSNSPANTWQWFPNIPYYSELERLFGYQSPSPQYVNPAPDAGFQIPRQRLASLSTVSSLSESDNDDCNTIASIGSWGAASSNSSATSGYYSTASNFNCIGGNSSPNSLQPSPLASPTATSFPSPDSLGGTPWDVQQEFEMNGHESELDELDKLMRRLNLDRNVRSSTRPMSGRAEELLSGQFMPQGDEDPMIVKNRLIQLLRQQERMKGKGKKTTKVCVFCRNNGEAEVIYSCHQLKDEEGRITCPILYCYTCPKCGATKENSHTLKYCPLSTGECPAKALKTARTSAGRRRFP